MEDTVRDQVGTKTGVRGGGWVLENKAYQGELLYHPFPRCWKKVSRLD